MYVTCCTKDVAKSNNPTVVSYSSNKTNNSPIYYSANKSSEFGGSFKTIIANGVFEGLTYIKEVIYSAPATIVIWSDGTKTIAKCVDGDKYNKETGLAICVMKKLIGGAAVKDLFDDWLTTDGNRVSIKDVRKKHK